MNYKYTRKGAIKNWDEGLALGNGEVGAMVWGGWNCINISLDRGDVWDTSFSPEDMPEFTLKTLLECKARGDSQYLSKIFDEPYYLASPTKLPMGRLIIKLVGKHNQRHKRVQTLDFQRAQVDVNVGETSYNIWLHANERVGIIKSQDDIDLSIALPNFGVKGDNPTRPSKGVSNKLRDIQFEAPQYNSKSMSCGKNQYIVQSKLQKINENEGFAIVTVHSAGNSKEYAFYADKIDINTNMDSTSLRLCKALEKGIDVLEESHIDWWKEYWKKSSIHIDNSLLEKGWYFHNYLLGAGSRKGFNPMPLQGLWTADDGVHLPPWKGDYHHDLNTELTYSSYLKANRLQQGESFLDYLVSLESRGKEFSQKFYGVEGHCLPAVMDIKGKALGGWAMYSLSPTNQLWLCQLFERYYAYTGDRKFLEDICYPYIKHSMDTIENLLVEKEGKLVLPFSSSPEIHDNTMRAFLPSDSNYDLSLMRFTAYTLVRLSEELGKETDTNHYRDLLNKLNDLYVDKDGVLLICKGEKLEQSHRHFSNAMAIYPLRLLDPKVPYEKRIIDATINSYLQLGTRNWTGYSFAIFANILIVAGLADEAQRMLEIFHNAFCLPNGLHCNGDYKRKGYSKLHYRPFTLEGNFCAQDALQEMLLYSEGNKIKVFPCVPKSWEFAQFETLRACQGVLVSANLRQGQIQEIVLYATKKAHVIIENDLQGMLMVEGTLCKKSIDLEAGQSLHIFRDNK